VLRQLTRGGGGGHGGGGGGGGGGHGGGSFGGGGGHFYGGGGGDGGGGGLFGLIMLLVIFAIIWFFVIRPLMRRARATVLAGAGVAEEAFRAANQGASLPSYAAAQPAADNRIGAPLAEVRAADAAFEPETFLQRAEMTYFLVNRAFQHRDAPGMQPFLLPALYEQRAAAVKALEDAHHKPAQLDLNIRGIHVTGVRHDENGDAILVNFDIVSRDRVLDDRDEKVVFDPGDDVESGASWLFARKAGATTVTSGGVVASKCPVCGAPLQLDSTGHCAHCNSSVLTGEHDWIVASMEPSQFLGAQPDYFLGGKKLAPQMGFGAIAASDPSFAPDEFMKRCGSAFEALEAAWQARDLTDARGFMSPGLYFAWQAQVEQLQERHRKNVLEHLHLDGVTPMSVTHGNAFDNVMVRIDATCADYEIDETTGHVAFGSKHPEPFTEYWTFQRGVGVQTSGKPGTLEKHCPNCGAPLAVNAIGECTYCKAAITSGKFDWVLSRIEQAEDVSL